MLFIQFIAKSSIKAPSLAQIFNFKYYILIQANGLNTETDG